MSRIEINLPDKYIFSTQIPVRLGDINRGNHLSHVSLLSIVEEARAQLLTSLGLEELNSARTMSYLIVDLAVVYKKQAYYGQLLKVEIAAADFRSKTWDLLYRVSNAGDDIEIARAKTGHALFDFRTQKVLSITGEFKSKFNNLRKS
jgi:acyl-CoA thioester hydrolase